jgi:large exoprotein involved in heme utilization and adhesion
VLQEDSQIAANAFQGKGGNIQINARGVFVCSDCQISASSDLGLEGVVEIRTPETNNNLQFVNLPQEVVQPEDKIAIACSSQRQEEQSQFIVTGRGGLPPRPTEPLSSEALVGVESPATQSSSIPKKETATLPPPARGWYVNKEGLVILASQAPEIVPYDSKLTKQECYGN